MYILGRLFVGWFSFKFTSCYVYSWGGFLLNLHPITSIPCNGKNTECKLVHPATSIHIEKLEAAELAEICIAAAILPSVPHRDGYPFSAEVYCSDSSDAGFALHVLSCEIPEVAAVTNVKER